MRHSTVDIQSVGGLGDGIGLLDGKPVFVPKSCAGDSLEVAITQRSKDFSRATITRIITAGPERTSPPCPHFDSCGGCGLQQLSGDAYQAFKRKVLADSLSHAGFPDVQAEITFLTPASRRRVDFKVTGGKLAFFGLRSHELVPINSCLILHPALSALVPQLEALLTPAITDASLTLVDSGIDLQLTCKGSLDIAPFKALAVGRIGINGKTMHEPTALTITLGGYSVPLPAGAFLQAAIEGQKVLTDFVLEHTQGAQKVADLFCGLGTYALSVCQQAQLQAFEVEGASVSALRAAISTHGLQEKLTAHARDLFQNPLTSKELKAFDAIIINPPRAGAKAQTEIIAASSVNKVVMISCNPASFARDAKTLKAAGFTLAHAHGLDQFVYSPHLEIAAYFTR